MIIALILLALVALTFGLGAYFRAAENGVIESAKIWDRLRSNLEIAATRESIPFEVSRDLLKFGTIAGCGCFTNAMLLDLVNAVLRRGRPRPPQSEKSRRIAGRFQQLSIEDKAIVAAIVKDVILFDSHHLVVRGAIIRFVLDALAEEAAKARAPKVVPVSSSEAATVKDFLRSAEAVADRAQRHGHVPQALLAA